MPTLVKIGNLKIQIFADDHNPPPFHVVTPDHEALVAIADLTMLRGVLRRSDLDAALKWASPNMEVLENEWQRLNG